MIPDRLNWNDIRYFLEVARKGRLLGAARKLGVNHTTVARRIAALEDALEVKLFEKMEDGFHLTHAGESLMPLANQMENATNFAKEQVQISGNSLNGNIRIGAPDGFGNAFLAGRISPFMRNNPGLIVELVPVPFPHNLLKREVDMSISLEATKRHNISVKKITDYTLFLYTSKKYLKNKKMDLRNEKDLLNNTFADYIADILYTEQLNFNRHISEGIISQFQSSTVLAQYEFIANGGGVGVLPHFMAWRDKRLVPVFTDQHCFVRSYWLLIPHELRRMASIRSLQNFILELAYDNQPLFMPKTVESYGSGSRAALKKIVR